MVLMGLVSAGFAASVSISPNAVNTDYVGKVSLSIAGLTVGKTVLVERFVDFNGNGAVDASQDTLTFSFKVTDGQVPLIGGVRNANVPGDDDGVADGAIRIDLPFPNVDGVFTSAEAKFIFRVSDPQNSFTPVTAVFQVTQSAKPQGVSGQITAASGGTPLSGAFVVVAPPNGSPFAATVTDVNGNYSFFTPPGSFVVFVVQNGFVSDQNAGAVTVVANQFATRNLALTSAGFTLSGKVSDSSSTAGIAGVFVTANSSANNLFSGGFADANGNYSLKLTPGQWQVRPDKAGPAAVGYLTSSKQTTNATASGSATLNFALSKATALIYGTVNDGANPVNGLQIKTNDQGNLHNTQGVTFAPNGKYVLGVVAGTWGVAPDSDSLNERGYSGGTGSDVTLNAGETSQVDFVVQAITAHLRGQIIDDVGAPIPNMQMSVQDSSSPSGTGSLTPQSDSNGNFDAGVRGGTWEISLNCSKAQGQGYINVFGDDFNVTDGVDQNNIVLTFPRFTATISGSVKDNLGHPIPGVQMDADQPINGSMDYGPGCVSTDSNGNYTLKVLGGSWTVSASSDDLNARGFNSVTGQDVNISNGTGTANFVATQMPPIITGPLMATATVGQLFVYQVTATGLPNSYGATPIPPNLSFNDVQGIIGGVPTTPGTTQVQLSATNSMGTGSATLTITVQPAPSSGPVIISGTSITARTGQPFSFQVLTKNASSSARLDASGLPPGLSADPASGIISGTPTSDGGFGVALTVTDGAATTQGILQMTCVSDPAFPVITSPGAATLTVGKFFSYTITAPGDSDPSDPTTFSIIGALPAGLSFNPQTATISGTPTATASQFTNDAIRQTSVESGEEDGPRSEGAVPLLNNTPPVSINQLVTHNKQGTGTKPLNYFPATATPAIALTSSSTSVNEGDSLTFIFSASIVDPVNAKTVHYQMSGKAKSGTDYTLSGSSGQIDIPAGAASATVTLTALTDMVAKEKNETVTMTLTKVAKKGASYSLSSAKKATVTIVNVP
ncbi:MAG: large repetitive protein [Verrucomicrobiota bacterium]|jgi:hypothetical protein